MKQPMRLKSGGFMSSGTDAGDLKILRTAKNIDDGSANGMKAGGAIKKKKKTGSDLTVEEIRRIHYELKLEWLGLQLAMLQKTSLLYFA